MEPNQSEPRRFAWLISVIAWDGVLPLFVAGGAIAIAALSPKPRGMIVILFATFVPLAALLYRATRGFRELTALGAVSLFAPRRIAFCVGLFLLLTVEAISSLLYLDGIAPAGDDWFVIGGLYLAYFAMMALAFRPRAHLKSSDTPMAFDNPSSDVDWPHRLR